MNVAQLTESLHAASPTGGPDLGRIVADGRRRQRRRRMAGVGVVAAVAVVVATPFLVVDQFDQPLESGFAAPPPVAEHPLATPVDGVFGNLNKFYLQDKSAPEIEGSSSLGLMSVWGEQTPEGVDLRYGWTSETDGQVYRAGTLAGAADLARGLKVYVVPSHRADATEPTFVVTHPVAPGARVKDYALGVMGGDAAVSIRTRSDVLPGYVVFAFSPLQPDGGIPDVEFLMVTGPDRLEAGADLAYDGTAWTWSPAKD